MTSITTTTLNAAVAATASVKFIASPPSFSPSPTPSSFPALGKLSNWPFPAVYADDVVDTSFDVITIVLVLCFVFLSLLCVAFILHLRIKSRHFFKLQGFSTHWGPRFLLVVMLSLWSINEFFRLPIFRKSYDFPFLPSLSVTHQVHFCKFHVILSLGLYEPGFLVVLLFLVNISIKKRSPGNQWAIAFVAITCLPLVVALYLAVYVAPGRFFLPSLFTRTALLLKDRNNNAPIVYCMYPLIGSMIFAGFSVVYALALLASFWKVVALVINKRLKKRVNVLVGTVLVCLAIQVPLSTISAFWNPDDVWYYVIVLINFVSVLTCGIVIEGILVIMPIIDSLDVASSPIEEGREHIHEYV